MHFGEQKLKADVFKRESLKDFRKKMRGIREYEWKRDALRLRRKTPEETIAIMFDLVNFVEKISRAKKCEV
jgi:hypothetical protein